MKYIQSIIPKFLIALTLLLTFGCGKSSGPSEVAVTAVAMNTATLEMTVGDTQKLTANISPSNASNKTITWSSSNASIATVKEGVVTANTPGTCTITAMVGTKTATCKVTVSAKSSGTGDDKKDVAVTSITLSSNSLTIKVGASTTITATVKPDNATDKSVTWTSSDASIASVNNGTITGIKEGTATITANAGDKSATCKVTVEANTIDVSSITLSATSITLTEGDSQTITATVKPDDATDKSVTWTSSNASIATVNNGTIKGIKEGTATITAKAGVKSATCTVTVNKKVVSVTSISLNKTSTSLYVGDTETLTATVSPSNATDKTVTWSTSDASIVTVNNGTITAIAEGTATITAKAGDQSATCEVTVSEKVIYVTAISLDQTSASLNVGATLQLTATVTPDNAVDKDVTWTSSNTDIATVSTDGLVTALKVGSTTITATAGSYSATCEITVTNPTGGHEGTGSETWK